MAYARAHNKSTIAVYTVPQSLRADWPLAVHNDYWSTINFSKLKHLLHIFIVQHDQSSFIGRQCTIRYDWFQSFTRNLTRFWYLVYSRIIIFCFFNFFCDTFFFPSSVGLAIACSFSDSMTSIWHGLLMYAAHTKMHLYATYRSFETVSVIVSVL